MFLARFSTKLHQQIDLTNALKSIFLDDSVKLCIKIAGLLRVLGGRAHACARAHASEKPRATRFGRRPCPGPGGPSRPNLTV